MHMYLIFLETTITGLHFTADNIGLYLRWNFNGGLRNFCLFRLAMLVSARAEALNYSAVKLFSKNSNLFEHGTWQTDRRTDRQTDDMQSHHRAVR